MSRIIYPEKVNRIIDIFSRHGHEAFAVGGCVRDSIMGKVPQDWDITTSATPDEMTELFSAEGIRTLPTGIKHGTVTVLYDGECFECTTYRIDGSYTDSRRPDSVEFSRNLADDLSRRDFTVNAMAASGDKLCDLFGGMQDLENKIIRCVGQPEVRFGEDALRILRALRFATVLDFEIDEKTLDAVKLLAHTLENISHERKTVELSKILCSVHAQRGVQLLYNTGVIKYLLPDASVAVENMLILRGEFPLRLATMMWQSDGRDLTRLRLSNEEKKTVATLLTPIEFPNTPEGARRTLNKYCTLTVDACILQGKTELAALVETEKSTGCATSIRQLAVDGNMLMDLNIPQRKIGDMLSFLLDEVLKNPSLNNKESLLELAKNRV